MIVDLRNQPLVERAMELDTEKLYLLSIPQTTPREMAENLAKYLKSLGVQAVVLALGDVSLYEVHRVQPPDVIDAEVVVERMTLSAPSAPPVNPVHADTRDFCPVCNGDDFIIEDGEEKPCPNGDCWQGTVARKS